MIKNSILIALIGLFISCKEEKTEVVTPNNGLITVTKEQFQSSKMEIATLMENEFNVTVSASGKIDVPPQYRAKITPFIGGYVKSSSFLVGDKVAKGQVLVTLENTEYLDIQKEYVAIAEQINYLKSEFERQKTLYNEKITSQKNYLKAESDYRQAKGMYQGLREKLLLLNINPTNVENGKFTSVITLTAPISGDITVMNANVGMFMSPSDIIMEVVDTQHLLLHLNVFESDILKIKVGHNIDFTIPQASKEVYKSKVKAVGKSIENKDRSISVLGLLQPELKEKLLSGMFVEASIILTTKKGLSVPNDAIIKENDKSFVLLLVKEQNNQFSFRKTLVATGEVSEHHTEIISDENVHQESKILVKGVFDLN